MKTAIFLILLPLTAFSQHFTVNNQEFRISTEVLANEWDTQDTVNTLYRIEEAGEKQLLHYYTFKDEGSDCNNSFWDKETMEVQGDSLIFLTHSFQKTGIDPIPEWRKQIYHVNASGQLILVFDRYKLRDSEEWVKD